MKAASIDIVITWVDNNDSAWLEDIQKHTTQPVDPRRYTDLNTLRYVFRGIESNLPWIRKIHLVTYGHTPKWLNINHENLNIVSHNQILPQSHLPTFNSSAIEMAFVNIPDLQEKFIYFNDDTIAINKTDVNDFFKNDLPVDSIKISHVFYDEIFSHLMHAIMGTFHEEIGSKKKHVIKNIKKYINQRYSIQQNIKNILFLLSGSINMLAVQHLAQPHLLSSLKYFHQKYPKKAQITMSQRFRSHTDHSQYAFKFLNFALGKFHPIKFNNSGYVHMDNAENIEESLNKIKNERVICINESKTFNIDDYEKSKIIIGNFLKEKLPKKSTYEIDI